MKRGLNYVSLVLILLLTGLIAGCAESSIFGNVVLTDQPQQPANTTPQQDSPTAQQELQQGSSGQPAPVAQPVASPPSGVQDWRCVEDSDGEDHQTKGSILLKNIQTGETRTKYDRCSTQYPNVLLEYWCSGNLWELTTLNCNELYGTTCNDGACTHDRAAGSPTSTQAAPSCVDSDGAIDEFTPGYVNRTVTIDHDSASTLYKDSCLQDQIYEYYCEGETAKSEYKECELGCTDAEYDACKQQIVGQCNRDSDCGEETYSQNFCSQNNVYQNMSEWICLYPGQANSTCVQEIEQIVIDACDYTEQCSNGNCTKLACYENDSGLDYARKGETIYQGITSTDYCEDNTTTLHEFYCANNNTIQNETIIDCLDELYDECTDGRCAYINQTIACFDDEDCGNNKNQTYCKDNNPWTNSSLWTCLNPGKSNASCAQETRQTQLQNCTGTQSCFDGKCVEEGSCVDSDLGLTYHKLGVVFSNDKTYTDYCLGNVLTEYYCSDNNKNETSVDCTNLSYTHCSIGACANEASTIQTIRCTTSTDCGIPTTVGGEFCDGQAIYRNDLVWECLDPGTTSSSCESYVTKNLVQTCGIDQECINGKCKMLGEAGESIPSILEQPAEINGCIADEVRDCTATVKKQTCRARFLFFLWCLSYETKEAEEEGQQIRTCKDGLYNEWSPCTSS